MRAILVGSGLLGVMMVLSACGSSNGTTTAVGADTSCAAGQVYNSTYGCLNQSAQCTAEYGASYGMTSTGQCVAGTTTTTSCALTSTQYGCLTQTAQCTAYGANYGMTTTGLCVIGTTTTTTTATSCTAGFVPTQVGCLQQGPCYSGFGWNGQFGQAAWCYPEI